VNTTMGCSSSANDARQHALHRQSAEDETTDRGDASARGVAASRRPGVPGSVNGYITTARNQQQRGSVPSGPDFTAYARFLGIDPVADHDLLWMAVESLQAPLPSDWSEHFDPHDRIYYYNSSTRVSTWTHPLEHLYREAYKTVVNSRSSNLSSEERMDQLQLIQQDVDQYEVFVRKEISHWSEHTDEHGHRFYFHQNQRRSTWTDPRPAFCHTLHLKMKTLHILKAEVDVTTRDGSEADDLLPLVLGDFRHESTSESESESESDDVTYGVTDAKKDVLSCLALFPGDEPAIDSEVGATEEAVAVGSCVICLSAAATHVIVPCGHQAFCAGCARDFRKSMRTSCPCCRTYITQIMKVYVPAPLQISPQRPEEPKKPILPGCKVYISAPRQIMPKRLEDEPEKSNEASETRNLNIVTL